MTRTPAPSAAAEDGASLVELLVTMVLLVLAGGLVAGAVLHGGTAVGKTRNNSSAAEQARLGFSRLDRDVRSAYAVNRPVRAGADWYLEFETEVAGTRKCTQWRLSGDRDALQVRTWTVQGPQPKDLTGWFTAATGVVNDSAAPAEQPFVLLPADAVQTRQAVAVHLLTRAGPGSSAGTAETRTRLVARNTSRWTATNADVDGNGQSDSEVCRQMDRS